jgi:hypothetical protein
VSSYIGPGTLVLDNGTEREVTAQMLVRQDGHLPSWGGTIEATDGLDLFEALESDSLKLRLGDRVGRVVLVRTTPPNPIAAVLGSGPPPFDM